MNNSTYYKNLIRLCLFKFVLFFSAFVFPEFNLQLQSAFRQSAKTELVELRVSKPIYNLKNLKESQANNHLVNSSPDINSFNIWAAINFNSLLETKFKAYRKKKIYTYSTSTKVLFKIPSPISLDEIPPLTVV